MAMTKRSATAPKRSTSARPVIADPDFLQVANLDARVLVRLRILLAERLLDTREILTRLLERDAA